MRRTILSVVASVFLLASGATPTAATQETQAEDVPLVSNNVELVTVLPVAQAIGAHFDGNIMYVTSTTGLFVYDISDPAAPAEIGSLVLPHFENEDVDLGGGILLISNDAAESTGILYVIDISDPTMPALLTAFPMGGNPLLGGPGHTTSCILDCRYAWVTDGAGIKVIDLTDPAAPVDMGTFETDAGGGIAVHDVQVDGNGLAWVVGFGGGVAYEIPKNYDGTSLGNMVAKTDENGFSTYIEQLGLGDGNGPNDYILHNSKRRKNDDVVFITEEDYTRPGCEGAGAFESWDLPVEKVVKKRKNRRNKVTWVPTGADLTPLDQWVTESLSDPTEWPENKPPASAMCSAHYFDLSHNIVAQGWYEQGLRLLDVTNPENIRQIGYFILPAGMVWAAYFSPTDPDQRIIYNLDYTEGVQVLAFDRPGKGKRGVGKCKTTRCERRNRPSKVTADVLPAWTEGSPALPPLDAGGAAGTWGYACRISLP